VSRELERKRESRKTERFEGRGGTIVHSLKGKSGATRFVSGGETKHRTRRGGEGDLIAEKQFPCAKGKSMRRRQNLQPKKKQKSEKINGHSKNRKPFER